MAIYAKFGSIKGNVTTTGLEGWVELDSFNWGYAATSTQGHGASQYRDVSVNELVLTMKAEQASVDLAQFGLNRTNIGALECKFTTTVQNKVDTFMNYKFSNCQIGRYSIAADAQGMPVETLSFSFQTVNFTFTARDTKLVGMPKSVTYDLSSAKTS